MKWTVLTFGKHKGKTFPQVMFCDPDWFFHAWENRYFKGCLLVEAHEIYRKSCLIRVSEDGGEKRFVEYVFDWGTGKFGTLRMVTGDTEAYQSVTKNMILKVIDMRIPRQTMKYDKTGYKNFLFAMKKILFGDPLCKMTKRRCEDFFEDGSNFVLDEGTMMEAVKTEAETEEGKAMKEAWNCVARWIETL
jgi:hypothetical protein